MCFHRPWFFVRVERFARKLGLEDVIREAWLESKKLKPVLEKCEDIECRGELRVE